MSDEKVKNNPLPQLLVTEAIRELSKRFENMNDKNSHIEKHIGALGRKPGFAMASQLCRTGQENVESLDEICKFIAGKFSQAIIGMSAKHTLTQQGSKILNLTFEKLPSWFNCLVNPGSQQLSPDQQFWFRCYASFIMGVYSGALLHFGYKTIQREPKIGTPLVLSLVIEDLDGTWEFSANMH